MRYAEPFRLANDQYIEPQSSFRLFRHSIRATIPLHWHEFYELGLIVGGAGTHVLNGRSIPLQPGDVFLLTPADFHELTPRHGAALELFNLIFVDAMLPDEVRELFIGAAHRQQALLDDESNTYLVTLMQRLWRESQTWELGHRLVVRTLVTAIVAETLRAFCVPQASDEAGEAAGTPPAAQRGPHPAIQKSLLYIQHHFRQPLTLEEVARHAQLTPTYFSECFHKTTGSSFQAHLRNLRLRFAMSLLCAAHMPVTEVCFASGYNTVAHFTRAFKQKYGRPPSAFVQADNRVDAGDAVR